VSSLGLGSIGCTMNTIICALNYIEILLLVAGIASGTTALNWLPRTVRGTLAWIEGHHSPQRDQTPQKLHGVYLGELHLPVLAKGLFREWILVRHSSIGFDKDGDQFLASLLILFLAFILPLTSNDVLIFIKYIYVSSRWVVLIAL
jgi:hypothetical protein